jgi:BirA family biotin operon repressor/biotin-[acetyl-CoA-carboxylase] ligase
VLAYLLPGSWISGEEMASHLGVSRAAVWKQIKSLRSRGYEIESSTNMGYRLTRNPDILDADLILPGLNTKFLGRDMRCFQEIGSTNETARSIAGSCDDGTVVLAEIQRDGRGRMDRSWASPPGGIWMSLILKPQIPMAYAYRINMAVGVALSKAISGLYGLEVKIKWPNDLLINDRKLCGILTDISAEIDRIEYAIVGIGINANVDIETFPDEWNATSLRGELGRDVSRIELIRRALLEIEHAYLKMGSQEIYSQWCALSATIGKNVRISSVEGNLEGEAYALSEDGSLMIRTLTGIRQVIAGDCVHIRTLPGRDVS